MPASPVVPYCGSPPVPDELWSRWNLDPILLLALIATWVAYETGARRLDLSTPTRMLFRAGWGVTAIALISPLCALSVALFSARIGQHMILLLAAAPLAAGGQALRAWRSALAPRSALHPHMASAAGRRAPPGAAPAAAAYALFLWIWHAPAPYGATFTSDVLYWAMHVTLFGAALWLWTALLVGRRQHFAEHAAAVCLTGLQMGVLGALLTFAPRPLFAPHLLTTAAWGLDPLTDQALGGAIMWAPSGAIFAGALALSFVAMLRGAERRAVGAARS